MNGFNMLPTKEEIINYPKVINENGCWIPNKVPSSDGYVHIMKDYTSYVLSRVSLIVFNNLDYFDSNLSTRHSTKCSKACFNPEHLLPGTLKDNMQDVITDGKNANLNKEHCNKCGAPYTKTVVRKTGIRKGQVFRRCVICANRKRRVK